ncbi:hypothetical protein NLG97_g1972 [Lecanicillium saksenae]|uniref:Uncharacterized protein n=1 Tax=Lecanicillium saksenae TaxID=468837 RepID=A0ACC1R446_9HYPO|nr:hypothetical protein NLG97_g1972 [Lecanicillium saksenae]
MLSSISTSTEHAKPDVEKLRRQPDKVIPDYLTPMPSHLLTITLSDLELCGSIESLSETTGSTPLLRSRPTGSPESTPVVQSPPALLPQGHHLVYFPIQAAPSYLAPDGADMDHSPGVHYSRRLWAGGEVVFRGTDDNPHQAGLVLNGQPWTCTETIGDVRVKQASAPLVDQGDEKIFVDVWRRYALGHPAGEKNLPWSIEERRTLVFMNPGVSGDVPTDSIPKIIKSKFQSDQNRTILDPHEAAHSVRILPSPRHLFHFSALTFNAHAIHLDPEYARSVDGHRAPLVHGPLTLALMLRVLTGYSGQLVSRFVYRNHAPLYVNEPLTVKVRPIPQRVGCVGRGPADGGATWDAWVEGPDGGLAVKGTATMAA